MIYVLMVMKELIIEEVIKYFKGKFREDCETGKVRELSIEFGDLNDIEYHAISFIKNNQEFFLRIWNNKVLLKVNKLEFVNEELASNIVTKLILAFPMNNASAYDDLRQRCEVHIEEAEDIYRTAKELGLTDEQWFLDWQDDLNQISVA